jgi:hypothetical protein
LQSLPIGEPNIECVASVPHPTDFIQVDSMNLIYPIPALDAVLKVPFGLFGHRRAPHFSSAGMVLGHPFRGPLDLP